VLDLSFGDIGEYCVEWKEGTAKTENVRVVNGSFEEFAGMTKNVRLKKL